MLYLHSVEFGFLFDCAPNQPENRSSHRSLQNNLVNNNKFKSRFFHIKSTQPNYACRYK